MARIRTIKPEFWTSEQVANVDIGARLMFIGIWNFCDDNGVHPFSVQRIRMQVFPDGSVELGQVGDWLIDLFRVGLLRTFQADGRDWIVVTGWRHQKIDRPRVLYPAPPDEEPIAAFVDDLSTNVRRRIDELSTSVRLMERNGKESKGEERNGKTHVEFAVANHDESASIGLEEICDCWNQKFGSRVGTTDRRRRAFATRIKDRFFRQNWRQALAIAGRSDFCRGSTGWKATLDWFLKPDSVQKLMEGNYDGRAKSKQEQRQERNDDAFSGVLRRHSAVSPDVEMSSGNDGGSDRKLVPVAPDLVNGDRHRSDHGDRDVSRTVSEPGDDLQTMQGDRSEGL